MLPRPLRINSDRYIIQFRPENQLSDHPITNHLVAKGFKPLLQFTIQIICEVANERAEKLELNNGAVIAVGSEDEKCPVSTIFYSFLNSIGSYETLKMTTFEPQEIRILNKEFASTSIYGIEL